MSLRWPKWKFFYYQTTDKEETEPITSFYPFFLLGFVCLVFFSGVLMPTKDHDGEMLWESQFVARVHDIINQRGFEKWTEKGAEIIDCQHSY